MNDEKLKRLESIIERYTDIESGRSLDMSVITEIPSLVQELECKIHECIMLREELAEKTEALLGIINDHDLQCEDFNGKIERAESVLSKWDWTTK